MFYKIQCCHQSGMSPLLPKDIEFVTLALSPMLSLFTTIALLLIPLVIKDTLLFCLQGHGLGVVSFLYHQRPEGAE